MKKIIVAAFVAVLFSSCSNEEKNVNLQNTDTVNLKEVSEKLLSKKQIDDLIISSVERTGDFDWANHDANVIYSALSHSDYILTVGYENLLNRSNQVNFELKNELIKQISSNEPQARNFDAETGELSSIDEINVFDMKVTNLETIKALLKDKRVRYIEPANYQIEEEAYINQRPSEGAGCVTEKADLKAGEDYKLEEPGSLVPWAFYKHNIPAAWNYSTGKGTTLAIIDTGLSSYQPLMNSRFNDGYSSGRTVKRYGVFVDSWRRSKRKTDGVHDKCGHGTSMSSVATAPRNDENMPVGVAYNANLIVYRATENVVLNRYHEKRGVAVALTELGKKREVKVISMSIGWIWTIRKIRDAVRYAYRNGKLVFAAGGTSKTWTNNLMGVIFPASMSETVAVTGVIEDKTTTQCSNCHKGKQIDFTFQMENKSGRKIPVLGYFSGQTQSIGGSSIATAATAGIAALVWAKHPNWSRSQVLNKLKQSAEFYPNRNSDYGYGNIDALKAVK